MPSSPPAKGKTPTPISAEAKGSPTAVAVTNGHPEFMGRVGSSNRPPGLSIPMASRGVAGFNSYNRSVTPRESPDLSELLTQTDLLLEGHIRKLVDTLDQRFLKLEQTVQHLAPRLRSAGHAETENGHSHHEKGRTRSPRHGKGPTSDAMEPDTSRQRGSSSYNGSDDLKDQEEVQEVVCDLDDLFMTGESSRPMGAAMSFEYERNGDPDQQGNVLIKVRQEWTSNPVRESTHRLNSSQSIDREVEEEEQAELSSRPARHCDRLRNVMRYAWRSTVISPQNPFQMAWEFVAVLVVLFDMFELPMQVFYPPESTFLDVMRWATQIFWNVDLLLSFRMGYFAHNNVVLEPRKVAIHYIQTWFAFDFLIVTTGWFFLLISAAGDSYVLFAKAGKTLKVCRAAKTIKMMRLMKMKKAMHSLEDHIIHTLFGSQQPLWGAAKFLLAIVMVTHGLSSLWFWIGDEVGDKGWVKVWGMHDLPFWEKYIQTFHWSLAQFGVGSSPFMGFTSEEYLVNIFILLAGLLITALLVSSITNTFSMMQQQTADEFHQMWLLRRFCLEREFPRWLSNRIAKHMEYQMRRKESAIQLHDVKLLRNLSGPLHAEVVFHIFLQPLNSHPLFRVLCRDDAYTMREVSTSALTEHVLAENDLVFVRGSVAKTAINVMNGSMSYRQQPGFDPTEEDTVTVAFDPQWISEQVLWTEWVHCGDLYAQSYAQCLAMDAMAFCEQVRRQGDTFMVVQAYAVARVDELRNTLPRDYTDLTELSLHGNYAETRSQFLDALTGKAGHMSTSGWSGFWPPTIAAHAAD